MRARTTEMMRAHNKMMRAHNDMMRAHDGVMRVHNGFTLIEVMVAVSILAIVTVLTWASFRQTFATKSAIEAQAGRYRTVRLALERMAHELSMVYVSQNEDTSQPERRTRLVGKHHSDIDEVLFSYFGHQRLYQDANEADTALVYYYAARDKDDSRKQNLMRRETRRLSYLKIDEQPGEADIACDDVIKLKLDYYDHRDKVWRDEWVTTALDGQPDRLPSKIRITLTVRDERGQEVPFQTEVRVAMSEPLNNQPKNLAVTGVGQPPALTQQPSGTSTTGTTGTSTTAATGTTTTTATGR
jgi:general secretion pathway protein J